MNHPIKAPKIVTICKQVTLKTITGKRTYSTGEMSHFEVVYGGFFSTKHKTEGSAKKELDTRNRINSQLGIVYVDEK